MRKEEKKKIIAQEAEEEEWTKHSKRDWLQKSSSADAI